jgi:hypothetical protein
MSKLFETKNPHSPNNIRFWVREFICDTFGCITTAKYYVGMPQATCRRCGHKNSCAQPQVPEWSDVTEE